MKELYELLNRDRGLLLWLFVFFLFVELTENYKWFTWASPLLFNIAVGARLNLWHNIQPRVLLIVLVFATYWLFSVNLFPIQEVFYHALPASLLFTIGYVLVKNNFEEKYLIGLLIITPLFTGVYDILYTLTDIFKYGMINNGIAEGNLLRTSSIRATSLISTELCSVIACLYLFFATKIDFPTQKLCNLGALLAVLAAICAMHFVSRTALTVVFVTVLVGIVSSNLKRHNTVFLCILVLVIAVLFFNSSIWDLYELKNAETDLLTANGRIDRMEFWIDEVMRNPFGVKGIENEKLMYAHNFWIDYAKTAGWIPGIFLVLFSLLNVKDVIAVMRNKTLYGNVKWFALALMIAFLLSYFVEPVYTGAKIGMFTYFFFCGAVSALSKKSIRQ